MATKPKPTVRTPKSRGNDRYANFKAKSNVANKLMDKAFKDGKPRAGTSVIERLTNKTAAWNLYEQATNELKLARKAKNDGKAMARAQAFKKTYKNKPR